MEYIDGLTATSRLDECGDVPTGVVRYLIWQLAKVSAGMMSKEVPAAGGAVGIDSETGRVTILPADDASDGPSTNLINNRGILPPQMQGAGGAAITATHHANNKIPDSPSSSSSLANKFLALYKWLAPDDYFVLFSENLGFNKIIVDESWKITAND